ncbi:MAG TPA: DUF86 domain-containing protein [bacterium]|nr:DUF86 domain-containing protein [bacterium]HPP30159.1 DUF86 domain-containing protein [bacterium]
MPEKEDKIFLCHISDAISRIEEYTSEIDEDEFIENHLIQDGVIRQIEIIGEATKRLSNKIKDKYTDIPWKDISGMRDKLIHHYFGIDISAVWKTVKEDIPTLKDKIKNILEDI